MKKIISLILVTVLLLSVFSILALAEEKKTEPTTGPADGISMYGGARCGIYETRTDKSKYVVNYDYNQGEVAVDNDAIPGMTYDQKSNTLTVKDVNQPDNEMFIWYMGNDFKLKVEGECAFGIIRVFNYYNFHGTSLNIIGSGTLTVNENKANDNAIYMFSNGTDPLMGLDIADSVTVHLYSGTPEGEDSPAPVVSLNYSSTIPGQSGAITVGGKVMPEAKREQVKFHDADYIPTIEIENRNKDYPHGLQVTRKSDPDGVYAVNILDNVQYMVTRYLYVEDLDVWVVDRSFSGQSYKKAEFEAEFDFVYGMAPTSIKYIDSYLIDRRGNEGLKMTKDDDPDAVYIGLPTNALWDWDESYTGNYEIHRVTWDDKQAYYVEDASFSPVDLMTAELEENGYQLAQESHDEKLELKVWDSEPSADDRNKIIGDVMNYESDPDGLYICTGEYTSETDGVIIEQGITVHKVHYDPEAEDHYILQVYSEPECFYVPNAVFESGESGFSYAYDTIYEPVRLRFLPDGYNIEQDLYGGALQLKKDGEPDTVYAFRQWTHYMEDDTEREEYGISRLLYNEGLGCYVEDDNFDEIVFYDLSYLDENSYEFVESYQPLEYVTKGNVYLNEYPAYTDDEGNTYYADYYNNVYSYSENDVITIGDSTYYVGTEEPDLSVDDLNSSEHEIVTDNYRYRIEGPEYHHIAGEQPADYVLGDADGDGEVTAFDVTYMQRFLAWIDVPASFDEQAADVDGDGEVTAFDVTWIQRWLAWMDVPYPIGE